MSQATALPWWPEETNHAWCEGAQFLAQDTNSQRFLDRHFRWPSGTSKCLCDRGIVSTPLIEGRRGIATRIQYQSEDVLIDIGFECQQIRGGRRTLIFPSSLREIPTECTLPALMDGFVQEPKYIVILDSPLSAITFGSSVGLLELDEGRLQIWIFGLRNPIRFSCKSLMNYWSPRFPRNARVYICNHDGLIPHQLDRAMFRALKSVQTKEPIRLNYPPEAAGEILSNTLFRKAEISLLPGTVLKRRQKPQKQTLKR